MSEQFPHRSRKSTRSLELRLLFHNMTLTGTSFICLPHFPTLNIPYQVLLWKRAGSLCLPDGLLGMRIDAGMVRDVNATLGIRGIRSFVLPRLVHCAVLSAHLSI
jgi:hypothetical protein